MRLRALPPIEPRVVIAIPAATLRFAQAKAAAKVARKLSDPRQLATPSGG